jgi:hypothetical protein
LIVNYSRNLFKCQMLFIQNFFGTISQWWKRKQTATIKIKQIVVLLIFILQKTIISWPFVTMNCIFTNDIIILLIHREISISICILVIYHGITAELYTFCSFTLVLSGSHIKKKRKWFLLFFLHCHYTLTLILKSYSLQLLLVVFFLLLIFKFLLLAHRSNGDIDEYE